MREGARKWKGPGGLGFASVSLAGGGNRCWGGLLLTTTGGVVPSLLAEVGVVLHCFRATKSVILVPSRRFRNQKSFARGKRVWVCALVSRFFFRWDFAGVSKRTLRAEELSRDVEGLAADDNDLLAVQNLLGDDGREAAKEMTLAIDDDLYFTKKLVSARLPSNLEKTTGR